MKIELDLNDIEIEDLASYFRGKKERTPRVFYYADSEKKEIYSDSFKITELDLEAYLKIGSIDSPLKQTVELLERNESIANELDHYYFQAMQIPYPEKYKNLKRFFSFYVTDEDACWKAEQFYKLKTVTMNLRIKAKIIRHIKIEMWLLPFTDIEICKEDIIRDSLKDLLNLSEFKIIREKPTIPYPSICCNLGMLYIPMLQKNIDPEKEVICIKKEIDKQREILDRENIKLNNEIMCEKAPKEKVEKWKETKNKALEKIEILMNEIKGIQKTYSELLENDDFPYQRDIL